MIIHVPWIWATYAHRDRLTVPTMHSLFFFFSHFFYSTAPSRGIISRKKLLFCPLSLGRFPSHSLFCESERTALHKSRKNHSGSILWQSAEEFRVSPELARIMGLVGIAFFEDPPLGAGIFFTLLLAQGFVLIFWVSTQQLIQKLRVTRIDRYPVSQSRLLFQLSY